MSTLLPLRKDWDYYDDYSAVEIFKYTVAHEIGHEILQALGGTLYSYRHKRSSTLLTQKPSINAKYYPLEGETDVNGVIDDDIDLMLYYKENKKENRIMDYERCAANVKDVLGLIWLISGDVE